MLHPNQFQVNEAWIVFKLNDAPIRTDQDGDFNLIALMDAASCFIMGFTTLRASARGPSKQEARRLLKEGRAHKKQFPQTLFVPVDVPADLLTREAERQGIRVARVPEDQLQVFMDDARGSFRELLGMAPRDEA